MFLQCTNFFQKSINGLQKKILSWEEPLWHMHLPSNLGSITLHNSGRLTWNVGLNLTLLIFMHHKVHRPQFEYDPLAS